MNDSGLVQSTKADMLCFGNCLGYPTKEHHQRKELVRFVGKKRKPILPKEFSMPVL